MLLRTALSDYVHRRLIRYCVCARLFLFCLISFSLSPLSTYAIAHAFLHNPFASGCCRGCGRADRERFIFGTYGSGEFHAARSLNEIFTYEKINKSRQCTPDFHACLTFTKRTRTVVLCLILTLGPRARTHALIRNVLCSSLTLALRTNSLGRERYALSSSRPSILRRCHSKMIISIRRIFRNI